MPIQSIIPDPYRSKALLLKAVSFIYRKYRRKSSLHVLLFHKVGPTAVPLFGESIKSHIFERQICFLKKIYEIVSFHDLGHLNFRPKSSKDFLILTFDDGYKDNYTHAFPVLKKHRIPATVFLATDYINTGRLLWYDRLARILYTSVDRPDKNTLLRSEMPQEASFLLERFFAADSSQKVSCLRSLALQLKEIPEERREDLLVRLATVCKVKEEAGDENRAMLSWDEVMEMSRHGISFGSHTRSHPMLSRVSQHEAHREITGSRRIIEEKLGRPVTVFAYPFGKEADYSPDILRILKEEGFEYACTTTQGHEPFPLRSPLEIRRKGAPMRPFFLL